MHTPSVCPKSHLSLSSLSLVVVEEEEEEEEEEEGV